ncbi:MAG: hypothetical protein LBI58_02255 [Tannerellaceae bacterium]|jgi:hypothetical protein|nr:hypothetical protein [Tannerellaceae bacterium]
MRYIKSLIFLLLVLSPFAAHGDGNLTGGIWQWPTTLLIYSPRYFGPSAFPIPTLRQGLLSSQYEVEVRGEYHHYSGDITKDLFLRAMFPIVRGRAAIEIRFIALEDYKTTPETRDERHAADVECPPNESYMGDVVISALYQLWKSKKWFDAMFSLNLKTASGGRLCDARFTDAATYWIDVTAGKNILGTEGGNHLRLRAMAGFYCWMTNNLLHRQNDAFSYGAGLTGVVNALSLSSDISGFSGYENNGDHPLLLRNNVSIEYRKNVLSLRYDHGMGDSLYDTYSVGFIRKF